MDNIFSYFTKRVLVQENPKLQEDIIMYEICKGTKGKVENGPEGKKEIECTKSQNHKRKGKYKKKIPHRHPKSSPRL